MKQPFVIIAKCLQKHLNTTPILPLLTKAGLNIGIANLIASEDLGADVVSGGELTLFWKQSSAKIYFHGNNPLMNWNSHQKQYSGVVDNPRIVTN